MRLRAVGACLGTIAAVAVPALAVAAPPGTGAVNAPPAHWQTVEDYCVKCHNTNDWAGSIAFDTLSANEVPKDSKIWESAIKKLRSGLMPPPTEKQQPDRAAVQRMVNWLETTLDKAQEAAPHVGHVPLQRLNRREYANAVRDLLGLEIDAATWLPQDR